MYMLIALDFFKPKSWCLKDQLKTYEFLKDDSTKWRMGKISTWEE